MEQYANSSGLSSSSSGLSALVKAANELFQVGKTQSELAQIAKFASAHHHVLSLDH